MNDEQKNRLRTYAWNYFAYHAEQRMKTFHFYLITVAVLITGFIPASARVSIEQFKWLAIIGFLITFFSITFAFLDKRNANLVKNGEAALKWLDDQEELQAENDAPPHVMSIFARDDYINEAKSKFSFTKAHVSYSKILLTIFWLIGLIGFIGVIVCSVKSVV